MKSKRNLVLTLSCLFTFACPAKAQNALGNDLSRAQPITIDRNCRKFTVDGRQISYDSCKHLLLTFHSSAMELNKVLRLDARLNSGYTIAAVSGLPAIGFIAADQVTHSNTPWVHATAISLDILFLADMTYLLISGKHRRKHLRGAIGLYNAEIKKAG
jgi:hypothetical protein